MKRNVGVALLLTVVMIAAFGCGEAESPATFDDADSFLGGLSPDQSAKLSNDLVSTLTEQGSADVIVQADPQVIFARETDAAMVRKLAADPAVIWKAREDGAVIWKFSPEQAVIWKMVADRAVIWKLTEELSAAGVPIEETYSSIHAFKAHLDLNTVVELAKRDDIAYISPDRIVEISGVSNWNQAVGADLVNTRVSNVNFSGLTGEGVAVAVVDSGIKKNHADFIGTNGASRVVASRNFSSEGSVTNVADNYGHGTHVAGIIAGNGKRSYDDGYSTTFEGVAPKANLVVAKVLNTNGQGTTSGVIAAMDWVLSIKAQYNVRVVNLSLGLPAVDPWRNDPLCAAVENAIANRMVVVVAAGNYGYYKGRALYGSIASPGISPSAITVGAADIRGTARRHQDVNGHNDDIAQFSSRGPTPWDGLAKPDLIAPGVSLISAYATGSRLAQLYPASIVDACTYGGTNCGAANAAYFQLSGTSMATPMVAGTAALLLEANPQLPPNSVKAVLMLTAQPLLEESSAASCYTDPNWRNNANCVAHPAIEQGSGMLNMRGATDLAENILITSTVLPGDNWLANTSMQPITYYSTTGEQVIWGQGLAWTGGIYSGIDMWQIYQEVYQSGVIWGTGLAWTGGITIGTDPVFAAPIKQTWSSSFVNPYSIAGDNDVLGGYSYDWEDQPDYSSAADEWFPEE